MVHSKRRPLKSSQQQDAGVVANATISVTPSLRNMLVRRGSQFLIIIVPLLLLPLLIVYPLAAIILQSVFPDLFAINPNFIPSLGAITEIIGDPMSYNAFFTSMWIGVVTAVLACILGTIFAFLSRRTDFPMRRTMDLLVWIVFLTPSFLVSEAWSLFFVRGGIVDQYVHLPQAFISSFFSPVGVIFILTLKTFPYVYLSVTAALHWLGSEFEDAARISGANSWRAWLRINIPLLAPAIFAAGLIAFAEAISDFGTAATIAQGSNVILITYQIYAAINTAPVNFTQAAALSLLLFAAIALALSAQSALLRRRSFQVISGKNRPVRRLALRMWKWPATAFCIFIFVVALVIPLGMCIILSFIHAYGQGLTASNWTLVNYQEALARGSDNMAALQRTFWLALGNATITTVIGLPTAFIIRRTHLPGRSLLSAITLMTIAVPGLILACGHIFAWNAPYLSYIGIGGSFGIQFYGTIWILLAANVSGSLPYATRLSMGAMDQVSTAMLETARVQGANLIQLLTRIVGPLLRSSLVSTWLLVFSGTMFELAAAELLYPPGQPTLPVLIMSFFDNVMMGPGMALAMLSVGLVVLVLIILRCIPWLIRRVVQHNRQKKTDYVLTD